MATISNVTINIRGSNDHARRSFEQVTESAQKMGQEVEHVGSGGSRAFTFLGRQISEMGEGLDRTNEAFGSAASGLGGLTSGLGEAIHGYHALHTVIEVATGAQMALNAVTPLGWAMIAGGALAAGAAYIAWGQHVETAKEKADRLHKALGDLANQHGLAFDRGANEKTKELQKELEEAQASVGKYQSAGAAAGVGGMVAGYLYEQHAISSAKAALDEFNEAVKKHREEVAATAADSMLEKVVEEANKLGKTSLQQFVEQLRQSGRTAKEQAEEIKQFREATEKVASADALKKSQEFVKSLQDSLKHFGQDSNQSKAADLMDAAQKSGNQLLIQDAERAEKLAQQLTFMQQQKTELEKQQQHYDQLKQKANELQDSLDPAAKLKDKQGELDELVKAGLISTSQAAQEMGKMREQLFRQMMGEQPKIDTGFVEFGSQAAAQLSAQQRQEDLQKQFHDETIARWEKQLEGQANGNRLLNNILGKIGNDKVMDLT